VNILTSHCQAADHSGVLNGVDGLQPYMGAITSNTRIITQIFSQLTAFIGLNQFSELYFRKAGGRPCVCRDASPCTVVV
jgi:hypothetical protein